MENSSKFEYKVIKLKSLIPARVLNKAAGEKGWKLVTIVPSVDNFVYYFVREIYQYSYLNEDEVFEIKEDE